MDILCAYAISILLQNPTQFTTKKNIAYISLPCYNVLDVVVPCLVYIDGLMPYKTSYYRRKNLSFISLSLRKWDNYKRKLLQRRKISKNVEILSNIEIFT